MTNRCRITAASLSIIFLLSVVTTTAQRENDSEAQQAMVQAEVLRAKWNETSLRQSAEQFDKAAQIWKSLGDFSNASRAALESGNAYFDFSQYDEALKRYHDVVALAAKKKDWLAEATALTKLARVEIYLGHNDIAQKHITGALDLLERDQRYLTSPANNTYGEAFTTLGELAQERGNFKKALTYFDKALKFLDGDQNGQARVHIFIGYIAGSIGNLDKAVAEISKALSLYRAINNRAGEGQAITALGLANSFNENQHVAIQLHNQAKEIFRSVWDRHSEAIAFNALGEAYRKLKSYPEALNNYQQALQLFEDIEAVNGTAPTNCNVALIHFVSERFDQALTYYERCLNLSRTAGAVRNEIYALNEMVEVYATQGRLPIALAQSERVQKFCRSIGDRRGLAKALNVYGDLLLEKGQKKRALDAYERAHFLSDEIGDKEILLAALYGLADANLALGAPEVALSIIQNSLAIIEDLRANVVSPEFRISYFSGVRKHYELCIEILMQLDRLHPGKGFADEALFVSEKSRARLLLDLVSESRASIREGATKDLLDSERELRGLIRSQAEYLSSSRRDPAEQAEVENQLVQLKIDYQRVEAQLRQQSPYLASLEQFAPLSLEQIQHELRDSDTMLLEYSLGDDQSYLWAITSASSQIYQLAGRRDIEAAVREYYQLLTMRQGTDGPGDGDYQAKIDAADKRLPESENKLSNMLLKQVADKLGSRRLIVVTEGALQLIPFDNLPVPTAQTDVEDGEKIRLLQTNEIVVEPSFSALIAIRNSRREHATSPGRLVAVIADPVVSASDERVHTRGFSSSTVFAASDNQSPQRDSGLVRLTHASEEADAISEVAPWGTTMVVKGFDANRETAMSADVGQYQIVHFASHGFVNSEHPELSSIVLTMVDRNGVNTNGLVSLHDIYSLDLSAELTVLSACQTALGKDIRGEGFVGLAHAFMSAGSKSVVASLWKVDDRATAVLMKDFYGAMLQENMSPAAALRAAKLKMMKDKHWSAPYYWAGFVLQGEYTNRITVDHHPWLRPRVVILFLLLLIAAAIFVLQRRKRRLPPTQLT